MSKMTFAAPALALLLGISTATHAQDATGAANGAANTANNAVNTVGNTAGNAVGQVGNVANGALGQVGNTANGALGQVGNTVGGLAPTLQPVTQGVGGALNNLTQPDTVRALLEFLAGVIPNHIEAHVNLDALRVEKLTVDVRGVDLRNLKVDLLVANSRNAGQVRPALNTNGSNSGSNTGTGSNTSGAGGSLPGDVPISGASTRQR